MDISDILYYIVIGFIAIFGYVSQQKAKRKAAEIEQKRREQAAAREADRMYDEEVQYEDNEVITESPTVAAEPTLEDIFKALRERRPLPEVKPRPVEPVVQPVQPAAQPVVAVKMPSAIPLQEGMRVTADDIASSAIDDRNVYSEAETSGGSNIARSIDWRQAVIATEILNRKY